MATIADLLDALESLPQHFSALAPSAQAAQQAAAAAQLLSRRVQSVPPEGVTRTWDTALKRCEAMDAVSRKGSAESLWSNDVQDCV